MEGLRGKLAEESLLKIVGKETEKGKKTLNWLRQLNRIQSQGKKGSLTK